MFLWRSVMCLWWEIRSSGWFLFSVLYNETLNEHLYLQQLQEVHWLLSKSALHLPIGKYISPPFQYKNTYSTDITDNNLEILLIWSTLADQINRVLQQQIITFIDRSKTLWYMYSSSLPTFPYCNNGLLLLEYYNKSWLVFELLKFSRFMYN